MIVKVYHLGTEPMAATHVASIVLMHNDYTADEALEFAFRWTQNIEGSWSRPGSPDHHASVKVEAPLREHEGRTYGHRSTMVDDFLTIGDRLFVVDSVGFREVPTGIPETLSGKPHTEARA